MTQPCLKHGNSCHKIITIYLLLSFLFNLSSVYILATLVANVVLARKLIVETCRSTKGVGATAPDLSEAQMLEDGVVVPLGKPKEQVGTKVKTL